MPAEPPLPFLAAEPAAAGDSARRSQPWREPAWWGPARRRLPLLVAAAVAAVNTYAIRATLVPVAYLDDASMHEQMVRYAASYLGSGRDPLRGWFPYLGLGSPQFLHYQPLGAMLTGLAGTIISPDSAFRWSLLLLWGAWPLLVYAAARIFGLPRWAAAGAAVVAPLLGSVPAVGYERGGYLWIGYGLWSQLCASWFLPLGWATSWRAVADRRWMGPAVLCTSVTIAFHFETGYLALMAPMLWPWLVPGRLRGRLWRAAAVLGLSLVAASWVLVPLEAMSRWASINEFFVHSPLELGYGAGRVLGWLFTGRVLDNGRFPVVSLLVAVGTAAAIAGWRHRPELRAVVVVGVASLLLCFGPSTWGVLMKAVPASHDLFFRRFMLGAQMAAIFLAGAGIATLGRVGRSTAGRAARAVVERQGRASGVAVGGEPRPGVWALVVRRAERAGVVLAAVAVAAALVPAVAQVHRYDEANAADITEQHLAEQISGHLIAPLIARINREGGGRAYAGDPSNWGADFTVGQVPVYKYLENEDVQEVGYTLRTASLMTDPEQDFDGDNPGDYALFGIRWLLYPVGLQPPPGAVQVETAGPYRLWELPANGWLQVVDTVGVLSANRADVGERSLPLLDGRLVDDHQSLTVAWAGAPAARPTRPGARPGGPPPGRVVSETSDLVAGRAGGVVDLRRRAVVVLSASYDPGWQVTVDGRRAPTQMLAPAVVGVEVPAGVHRVEFRYVGYRSDPELALLSVAALVVSALLGGLRVRRRR